jgi:hypothetical protein
MIIINKNFKIRSKYVVSFYYNYLYKWKYMFYYHKLIFNIIKLIFLLVKISNFKYFFLV